VAVDRRRWTRGGWKREAATRSNMFRRLGLRIGATERGQHKQRHYGTKQASDTPTLGRGLALPSRSRRSARSYPIFHEPLTTPVPNDAKMAARHLDVSGYWTIVVMESKEG
jgi:hypothetical protein